MERLAQADSGWDLGSASLVGGILGMSNWEFRFRHYREADHHIALARIPVQRTIIQAESEPEAVEKFREYVTDHGGTIFIEEIRGVA